MIESIIQFFVKLFTPSPQPKPQPKVEIPPPPPSLYVQTPLSWEKGHPERREWSDKLISMISREDIFTLFEKAVDVKRLRPDWDNLNKNQKVNCLAEFWCQLSIYESSWNPACSAAGVSPDDDALGLFQM